VQAAEQRNRRQNVGNARAVAVFVASAHELVAGQEIHTREPVPRMTQSRATPRLLFDHRMDATLVSIVKETTGSSWKHRAELFCRMSGVHKTAKQLRERFTEHIDPDRNYGDFDEDEAAQLVHLFRTFGPVWSHLASLLRGRTAGRVKNEMMKQILRISRSDEKEGAVLEALLARRTRKRVPSLRFDGFDNFDTDLETRRDGEGTLAYPVLKTANTPIKPITQLGSQASAVGVVRSNATFRVTSPNCPNAPAILNCEHSTEIDWLEVLQDLLDDANAQPSGKHATPSPSEDGKCMVATCEDDHVGSPAPTNRTHAKRAAGVQFSVFSATRREILKRRLKPARVLAYTFRPLLGDRND
tara:strand:+ start:438 stop:1508 length:1071 start_codon:yes stop_codon:yes gene_type:complete